MPDSICERHGGILTPARGIELVRALKSDYEVPIVVHTHCTSGIAQLTYQAVVKLVQTRIDTALSPLSEGTSQPPTESLVIALRN